MDDSQKTLVRLYHTPCRSKDHQLLFKLHTCRKFVRALLPEVQKLGDNEAMEQALFLHEKFFSWIISQLDMASIQQQAQDLNFVELDQFFSLCHMLHLKVSSTAPKNRMSRRFTTKKRDVENFTNHMTVLAQERFLEKIKNHISFTNNDPRGSETEDPSLLFSPLSFLSDQQARSFWSSNFGQTYMVPWPKFERTIRTELGIGSNSTSSTSPDEKQEEEANRSLQRLQYILDHLKTGMISIYRFAELMKIFGPLNKIIDNVNELVEKKYFNGYLPREESTRLLTGYAIGTFIVRFSRSSPGSFVLSYVDANRNVQHVKIPMVEKRTKTNQIVYLFQVEEIEDGQPKFKCFNSIHLVIDYYREQKLLVLPFSPTVHKLNCFFGELSSDDASLYLRDEPVGTYLIRFSSQPTNFAISFLDKSRIVQHMLIKVVGSDGSKYQLQTKALQEPIFDSINDLLNNYSSTFEIPLKNETPSPDADDESLSSDLSTSTSTSSSSFYQILSTSSDVVYDKIVFQRKDDGSSPSSPHQTESHYGQRPLESKRKDSKPKKEKKEKKEKGEKKKDSKAIHVAPSELTQKDESDSLYTLDESGKLLASKLESLVDTLLGESDDFRSAFLMTFRSFMPPNQLVLAFKKKFLGSLSRGDMKPLPMITEFLKHWICNHDEDNETLDLIQILIQDLLSHTIQQQLKDGLQVLLPLILKKKEIKKPFVFEETTQAPILPLVSTDCPLPGYISFQTPNFLQQPETPPQTPSSSLTTSAGPIQQRKSSFLSSGRQSLSPREPLGSKAESLTGPVVAPAKSEPSLPITVPVPVPVTVPVPSSSFSSAGAALHSSSSFLPSLSNSAGSLGSAPKPAPPSPGGWRRARVESTSTPLPPSVVAGLASAVANLETIPVSSNLLVVGAKSIAPSVSILHYFHPEEFARQLTLLEHELYCKIMLTKELVSTKFDTVQLPQTNLLDIPDIDSISCDSSLLLWTRREKNQTSPNIMKMIEHFNQVSSWVASVIVKEIDLKDRKALMEFFIQVLVYMRRMNNFYGMMEILSAFNSSPVARLKKTFAALSVDAKKAFEQANELFNSANNYKIYKASLTGSKLPCIPFLGLYLSDLTFINDGNKSMIDGEINFKKCEMLAKVLTEMKMFQGTFYNIWPVDLYQIFLSDHVVGLSEEERWALSKTAEPKVPPVK